MTTRPPTDLDLTITDDEIEMLKACQSKKDWSDACLRVKRARNGLYPQDWHHRVIKSGLMDEIAARWGDSSEFSISIPTAPTINTRTAEAAPISPRGKPRKSK